MLFKMEYDPNVHPHSGVALPLGGFMATKDFTPVQVDVLLMALGLYVNSMTRRVVADVDPDGKKVWQSKVDAAQVLMAKIRS